MPGERIPYLLERFSAGICTAEEMEELEGWYQQLTVSDVPWLQDEESTEAQNLATAMLDQFRQQLHKQPPPVQPVSRRRILYRIAAAAAVLLLVSVVILYLSEPGVKNDRVVETKPSIPQQDVMPGGNHAILILADGRNIMLDTAKSGNLVQQGSSAVLKSADGLLVYKSEDDRLATTVQPVMNMVRTPRGGQYQVQLPDGSRVWLNAESSIRFPVQFAGKERRVEVSGEVYVEAAPSLSGGGGKGKIPFIVDIHKMSGEKIGTVEVLGTHFNINAYDDEGEVRTTLLEGSVKVTNKYESGNTKYGILRPGQQARIANNQLSVIENADVEEAVAWKNGLFRFNDADMRTILRQASRWYDIEVEFRGYNDTERFRGKISRDVKLSEFLRILEVNQVPFQREGRKIIIQ